MVIGGFGEVFKAIHKLSNLKRAVKFITKKNLDAEEKNRLVNEVEILKSIVQNKHHTLFSYFIGPP